MSEDRPQDPPSPWSTPPDGAPSGQQPTQPAPYGQQPYGQQPYGQQQPAYGQPPGYPQYATSPDSGPARSSATLWLILNIASVLFCGNLPGIVGAIYAGLALGRADADAADARRKTRTAKIWFFAGLILAAVLAVVAVVVLFAVGLNTSVSSQV